MTVTAGKGWSARLGRFACLVGGVTALLAQGSLPASAAVATSGPPHGGTLTMAPNGIQANLDPAIGSISNYSFAPAMEAIYGPGLDYILPSNGAVVMGFAKSIKPSNGFKVWTVVLHPGLKFSDGTPFDAAAVAADLTRLAKPGIGSIFRGDAKGLKTKVESPTTLTITLPAPNSQFDRLIAVDFSAIPSPTAIRKEGKNFGSHPVGAGPFVLSQTVLNASQTFLANKYFGLFEKGQPYLDKVVIQSLPSTTQEINALRTGAAQMTWTSDGQTDSQMAKAGLTVKAYSLQGPFFLSYNDTAPPFNNVLAREAVYYALDRSAASQAWAPGNKVSQTMFTKSSPLYSDKHPWPAQNKALAQKLFDKLAADGHPLKFAFMLPTAAYPTLAQYVQAALSSYKNVKMTIDSTLVPEYVTRLEDGKYQLTAAGEAAPTAEPFLTELYQTGGSTNFEHWSDPKVDAALKDFVSTANVARQKADWDIVSAEADKQFPFIPTQQGVTALDYTSKVGGVKPVWYGETPMWNDVYLKS